MDARVCRQFWVEADPEDVALLDGDDVFGATMLVFLIFLEGWGLSGQCCHDLDLRFCFLLSQFVGRSFGRCDDSGLTRLLLGLNTVSMGKDPLNNRSPDEDASVGLVGGLVDSVAKEGEFEICLEALCLPSKVVPVDAYVETANEVLAALLSPIRRLGQQD